LAVFAVLVDQWALNLEGLTVTLELGGLFFEGDDTLHIGPDASLVEVVPDGTAGARFDEHRFTVAHDEALVAEGQWEGSIDTVAWVVLSLRGSQTVGTAVLEDADVLKSSSGTERLAFGVW